MCAQPFSPIEAVIATVKRSLRLWGFQRLSISGLPNAGLTLVTSQCVRGPAGNFGLVITLTTAQSLRVKEVVYAYDLLVRRAWRTEERKNSFT